MKNMDKIEKERNELDYQHPKMLVGQLRARRAILGYSGLEDYEPGQDINPDWE